jgi:hypothetical protein
MTQYETTLDETWAEGELVVRPGESIVFEGSVTGVSLDDGDEIELVFNATQGATYQYEKGYVPDFASVPAQQLIVKHVEQALIDAGYRLVTEVAAESYGEQ